MKPSIRRKRESTAVIDLYLHGDYLKSIDLSWNGLDDSNIKELAWGLAQCRKLEVLNLGFNRISDRGSRDLTSVCRNLSALESVVMIGNQLKACAIEWIKECPSLLFFNIALNPIENVKECVELACRKNWSLFCIGLDGDKSLAEGFAFVRVKNYCQVVQIQKSSDSTVNILSIRSLSNEFEGYPAKNVVFGKVHNESKIDFRNAGLKDVEISTIFSLVHSRYDTLTHLDLSKNSISSISPLLCDFIAQSRCLKLLFLNENALTDVCAHLIAKSLEVNNSIEWFDLRSNQIEDSGASDLLKAVCKHKKIWKVFLLNNRFDKNHIIKLGCDLMCIEKTDLNKITKDFETLRDYINTCKENKPENIFSFDFSWNAIRSEGIQLFAQNVHFFKNLKLLYLRNNDIVDEDACILFDALFESQQIKLLDLSDNKISNTGAAHLADKVVSYSRNIFLILDQNEISNYGAEKLFGAMKNNVKIEKLALCKNPISADFSFQLEVDASLLTNQSFRVLDQYSDIFDEHVLANKCFKGKPIDTEIARNLSFLLSKFPTETLALDLSSCSLEDSATQELCLTLPQTCIEYLDLSDNKVSDEACNSIGKMIENNMNIREIPLKNNFISSEGLQIIERALAENISITKLTHGLNSEFAENIDLHLERNALIRLYLSRVEFFRWILPLKPTGDGVIQEIFLMADLDWKFNAHSCI
jgi:Ran GTPase-activating protein (RanGAP) involved in mRNA processing and transport